ncbi:DUF3824 domain-containing protein [Amorphoplanes digitatis]|uniref:Uncharacterized protein n=1 Tax=Actinoplanes digitatis TaxID=1868 RepID=A0A7W7I6D8_9ACTN|nr:DUF3824 domain-containing protein [Actinoplanes digitatis]MBB4767159.1 hypothetical protein [Actinoplanes digitatis]GID95180.1 hypothetical protein Adi01nite_45920 [Actinoplanes digitatis]
MVTVSSYLLYLSAAASIIAAVLSLTTVGTVRDVYADLYDGTANAGMETFIVAATVGAVVINILFAGALAILAIYNNRGKQPARITTWVVGGIFLCCNGFGLLGTALSGVSGLDSGGTGGPSAKEIQARLSSELPGWLEPVSTLLTVLVVLALLAAVILLALPAANEYFRKPQVAWDPLNQYPGYPAQQPPYPGQPHPGQPYPGQPYPGQPAYPPYPGGDPSYPGGTPTPPAPPAAPPAPPAAPPASGEGPGAAPEPNLPGTPPNDPWSAPPPPPPGEDKPGRSPTDPA